MFKSSAPSRGTIIVVDDNLRVSEEVCLVLERAGWVVRNADGADLLREMVAQQVPDMVLLDLNLPGEDGISLCKWLRSAYPDLGIVMLTARVMGIERTEGYIAGADVYLTKPTRPEELRAVIHNLSNRTHTRLPCTSNPWSLQLKGMRLISPQLDILSLTPSECVLLREVALCSENCSYQQLIEKLGSEGGTEKSDKARLEVLVSRLRSKMASFIGNRFEIKTVHGIGYRLTAPLQIQSEK